MERCGCGCLGGGTELLLNLSARGVFLASSFAIIYILFLKLRFVARGVLQHLWTVRMAVKC